MSAYALSPSAPTTPAEGTGWFKAVRDLPREHGFEPLRLEGRLPEDLVGTLYRNGPSLFSNFGRGYHHWFDGDGAVNAVRFNGRSAEGAVRVTQTPSLLEERKVGRPLYTNYDTNGPGFFRRLFHGPKNTANTSVIIWQDRLFALQEGSKPVEVSREDLHTIGETSLDGVITHTFSAHPHRVRERNASYNFGLHYAKHATLAIYELPDAGPARKLTELRLSGHTMIHDFIATPNYLIFFAPPLHLRLLSFLLGRTAFSSSLQWLPERGTEVIVVPIDRPNEPIRFHTDAFYQWHFANAFERGGELVVDVVRYPDFTTNAWLRNVVTGDLRTEAKGRFGRAVIDLAARKLRYEEHWDRSCEFPRLASRALGQEHRWVYVASHARNELSRLSLFSQIAKVDVETGRTQTLDLGPEQYPSEPVFVAKRGGTAEDDGYLLTLVYDAHSDTSHVAVLDAKEIEQPPLARVHFDHMIPFTFHGNWAR